MLTIIIVNFFSENLVRDCIHSIKTGLIVKNTKIVVVDNGSNTSILSDLENSGDIRLVKNNKNSGFSKACNLGAKEADTKYLLFLNPDTKVFKSSLIDAIDHMEDNPSVNVLGCKQVDEDDEIHRSCARYVTLPRYLNKILRLNRLFPRLFKGYHMSDWDHRSSRYVDHVIGAFYLIRTVDFLKVGGFTEDYFVYYEDLDLSKKITDLGGHIYYNSDIEIFHQGGGTSESFKAERLFYSLDSLLIFGKKYLTQIEYLVLFFMVMFIEPLLRLTLELFKLKLDVFFEVLKSYKMLYKKRIF